MSGSSGGGTTQTTQTSEPWPEQQPYLKTGFEQAQSGVLNRPLEYFPESTVVPFAPETEAAMGAQGNRAMQGSPLLGQAQQYTSDVMGGNYLDPMNNPYFSSTIDSIMSSVRPGIDSQFAGAGRQGSGLHAESLGTGLARGAAPYLSNLYQQERGYQENAAGRAPGLAREDYFDIGQLANVGAQREAKAQEGLQDSISRWNFGQSEPTNRLSQYMNLIQGNYGGTSTASQTAQSQTNPLGNILGAGLGLAGTVGSFPTAEGGSLGADALGK